MLRHRLCAKCAQSLLRNLQGFTVTAALAATLLAAIPDTTRAYAGGIGGFVANAAGVIVDPLKLGKASDNLLQSVEAINTMLPQIQGLEGKTNDDLEARITQVQIIVDKVIAAVDQNVSNLQAIVADAERQVKDLESKIFLDAQELLRQVQCLTENVLNVQIQQGFASALNELKQADPSIRIFNWKVIDINTNNVQPKDAFDAYHSAKQQLLDTMNQLGPNAPAYSISHTYAAIANLAYLARCGDLGNTQPATDAMLLRDQIKFEQLQEPWMTVVVPSF